MATPKAAVNKISNANLWNAARSLSPTFAAHTAEGTAELFTDRGFSQIEAAGMAPLNEFWGVIMPYYLNIINISHAADPLDAGDVGEYFENAWAEYAQRMAVNSITPISPQYRDLKNGDSPDPFIVRKPEISDRFFQPNFDYQSLITIPDEWMTRRIFVSEFGFSEVLAGVYAGLENGYIIQKYEAKKEAINKAINDTSLQDTQKISVALPENPTEQNLVDFVLAIKNVISIMKTTAQTAAFNALGFSDRQDVDRLRLLVRPNFKNKMDLIAARNSYHAEALNIPVPVIEVSDFGGLVPTITTTGENPTEKTVYPVYDSLGAIIGFADTANASEVKYQKNAIHYTDPNANVVAVLMDKGAIFEIRRNPYQVEPIRNPRGRYNNMWASSPNNTIAYDRLYTMIRFDNSNS